MGSHISCEQSNTKNNQPPLLPEYLLKSCVPCNDWSAESIIDLHNDMKRLAFKHYWFGWHYDITKVIKVMKLNPDSTKNDEFFQV